jgi:membrane protein implicated in regulation of membrane protease activity
MSRIDWPLAILLAVIFVVASVARWRYFRARYRRQRKD